MEYIFNQGVKLLCSVQRCKLQIFWRAWHLRNDVVCDEGMRTISSSADYLERYIQETGLSTNTTGHEKDKKLALNTSFSNTLFSIKWIVVL
jgi:hypothetical protein